jgi:CheY-like chemotaxis protein
MKILMIDDDILFTKALSFSITEAGHTVDVVSNGQEALHLLAKKKDFDVIFCDIMMPVLTGPGFLLMLSRHFGSEMPTIVIISGINQGNQFLSKLAIKYDHFLKKPVVMSQVMELIAKIERLKMQR